LVAGRHRRPGIVQELLETERDLLCGLVHAQNLHGYLIARRDDLTGVGDPRPAHVGHVEQTLNTAAKIHEGAERRHRDDPSCEHRAWQERLTYVRSGRALPILEGVAP